MPFDPQHVDLVILDRDGVINANSDNYIRSLDAWHPLSGSLEAIAKLTQSGRRVAVATNQSALARGYLTEAVLTSMHDHLRARVTALGGRIDHVAYCPHHPKDGCQCRKPATGMLDTILNTLGVPASRSLMVGDKWTDLAAGLNAGCHVALVGNDPEVGNPPPGFVPPTITPMDRWPDLATLVHLGFGLNQSTTQGNVDV